MTTSKATAAFQQRLGKPTKRSVAAGGPKHAEWDALRHDDASQSRRSSGAWSEAYGWKIRISDFLTISAVILVAYVVWFVVGGGAIGTAESPDSYLATGVALLLVWTADLELHRTRTQRVVGIGATEYKRVTESTLRVFGAMGIIMIALHIEFVRGFFILVFPLGIVSLLVTRWAWRQWLVRQRRAGQCLTPAVILGQSDDVGYVIGQLKNNLSAGYVVVGVALTVLHENMELLPPWHKIPVLSSLADIGRVVSVTGAQTVIVAGPLPGGPQTIRELGWRLEDMATELVLASNLTNVAGPRIHFRPVEGLPLVHVELPQYSGGKHIVKRAMDMVLSAMALVVLSPLLVSLAVIVKTDGKGPVLFFQDRVGRNGRHFKMAKFRSMVVDAEEQRAGLVAQNEGHGALFKIANDPRVTRCGRWMRKYSLDELPQLWNVLMGDMSLVGPRPPLKAEVDSYEKPVHRRLLIKPGITGLWQVSGRSNLVWDEAVRLDLYYVENWSVTGDIIILWRTVKAVLKPSGAY